MKIISLLIITSALMASACSSPAATTTAPATMSPPAITASPKPITPPGISVTPTAVTSPQPTPSVSIIPPVSTTTNPPVPAIDASALFKQNCAPCHGFNREGVVGPALTAAALTSRGRNTQFIIDTITNGIRNMPAWKDRLTQAQINALAQFLQS